MVIEGNQGRLHAVDNICRGLEGTNTEGQEAFYSFLLLDTNGFTNGGTK